MFSSLPSGTIFVVVAVSESIVIDNDKCNDDGDFDFNFVDVDGVLCFLNLIKFHTAASIFELEIQSK